MPQIADGELERELTIVPKTYLQTSGCYGKSQPVFVETTVGLLFCYLPPYTFLMNLLYRYKALQFSGDLLLSWLILLKIIWDRISRYSYTKGQKGLERPSDLAEITEGGREEGRT